MADFSAPLLPRLLRAGASYVVAAWLLVQIAQEMVPLLYDRSWVRPAILATLAVGFAGVLVCVWLRARSAVAPRLTGRARDVGLALGLLAVTGLQSYRLLTPSLPGDVVDSRWQWVSVTSLAGEIPVQDCCTVQFEHRRWFAEPKVIVRTDCDEASGPYAAQRYNGIAIGTLGQTGGQCVGPTGEGLIGLVRSARSYDMKDGELFLETPGGNAGVRLRRCTGPHVYEDESARRSGCV